jgi:transcriptional antiterminator
LLTHSLLIMEQLSTRKELAKELGISYLTLWRKIQLLNIQIPNGRLTPRKRNEILAALGYETPPLERREKDLKNDD